MARSRRSIPQANLGKRGESYRVYWSAGGRKEQITLGVIRRPEALARLAEIDAALGSGVWPEWARETAAVKRLLGASSKPAHRELSRDEIAARYHQQMLDDARSAGYIADAETKIKQMLAGIDKPLTEISEADALAYINSIMRTRNTADLRTGKKTRTAATRNRHLAACNKFFHWLIQTGVASASPFAGIGWLREEGADRIVHLTRSQRDQLLTLADDVENGLSVWIALLGGLRLIEIWRLTWADVFIDKNIMVVRKDKKGKGHGGRRTVPLHPDLAEKLRAAKPGRTRTSDPVVPWPLSERAWDRDVFRQLKDLRRAWAGGMDEDARGFSVVDLINYRCFRHSFSSLSVQSGISLEKVIAWCGHTREVALKHYTEFVPDGGDPDIAKL